MVVGDAPSIEPLADVESSSKNSRGGKRPSLWKVQSAGVVWVWWMNGPHDAMTTGTLYDIHWNSECSPAVFSFLWQFDHVWSGTWWGMETDGNWIFEDLRRNWWRLDLWWSLKIPNRACSQVTPCPSLSVAGYSNYEFDPWTAEVHQASPSSGSVLTTMMDESQDGRSLHDGQLEESDGICFRLNMTKHGMFF